MSDVTTESLAADLAEQIYERWTDAAGAGYVIEFGAIDALAIGLIGGLRTAAIDPLRGAAWLRAAIEVLADLPLSADYADQGQFERLLKARTSGPAARYGLRTGVRG